MSTSTRAVRERVRAALDRSWRPGALLLLCCLGWWAVTATGLTPAYLVPSPAATFHVITGSGSLLWKSTWVTGYETVLGFAIASVLGVIAAVVTVYSSTAEKTLYPVLLGAQVVPKIAIAPLFVVWLGFGLTPKITIAALIAFFPVVVSTVTGLKSVDPELLELSATMGAGPARTFAKIRFPAALPHLFSGLKVAVTLAVTGAVVGEFVGANQGLGVLILEANGNLDTPTLFASLVILTVLGVVLYAVIDLAERLLLPWHAIHRASTLTSTT